MRDIQDIFIKKGVTLSLAESCTGGRIASMLTKTPGASGYFLGGVVCYCDQLKINLLGVSEALIEEKTAVDIEVARQMCHGVLKLTGSDYALAVTGDAGPLGDQVGTVFGAIGSKEGVYAGKIPHLTKLTREEIMMKSGGYLLVELFAFLHSGEVPFAHK
jgi:PncC family amidohydrolase